MTSVASKPSGTKTVVTVSEYHSEPCAHMRKPHASTAARTPLASRLWREKTSLCDWCCNSNKYHACRDDGCGKNETCRLLNRYGIELG